MKLPSRVLFVALNLCAALAAKPSDALTFDVSYDSSVGSAPVGFTSAFAFATSFLSSTYVDPITINMHVGWGEINGGALAPGNLGQSLTNQQGFYSYGQVKNALISDAKSASDFQAVGTLPVADPTGGRNFVMSNAEAKALGLLAGNATGIDGYVGFNKLANYTFNPNNRAVAGEYDFIGLALHEITEVMGRYGMTQNGCGASLCDSPIDLFRYTGNGVFNLNPTNGSYFSIDSGATNLNTFNGTSGGDLSDWAGLTPDAFNHSLSTNQVEGFSPADITLMDAIGYDPTAAVPEPSTWAMMMLGFLGIGFLAYRRRDNNFRFV
jgi:hypothetical protein